MSADPSHILDVKAEGIVFDFGVGAAQVRSHPQEPVEGNVDDENYFYGRYISADPITERLPYEIHAPENAAGRSSPEDDESAVVHVTDSARTMAAELMSSTPATLHAATPTPRGRQRPVMFPGPSSDYEVEQMALN